MVATLRVVSEMFCVSGRAYTPNVRVGRGGVPGGTPTGPIGPFSDRRFPHRHKQLLSADGNCVHHQCEKKSPRVSPRGKVGWWRAEKWHIGDANARNGTNQISMMKKS